MSQPMLRTKLTHDPASLEGQSYAPIVVAYTASPTSGSGVVNVASLPQGFFVEEVIGVIIDALDAGTVDIGLDGDTNAFIANSEWTETNLGASASSKQTTLPKGMYLSALDILAVEFGGACTEGKVLILVKMWDLNALAVQGYHAEVETT